MISFNFDKKLGRVKAMHGVGQPPRMGISDSHMHYLTEAHIPFSRLHDVGGLYGGNMFVDIPNIFRDFSADENLPESYDFAFTDILLKQLHEAGVEPIYRLGVTIENYQKIRAYRIDPPSDPAKWARICEHIIRHYNEGWADGFKFGIKYWEIWNEPDGYPKETGENEMWSGTPEQYFELYDAAAKHLKACFGDSIKVGGYAACGFYAIFDDPEKYGMPIGKKLEPSNDLWYRRKQYWLEFFDAFLKHIKESGAPLDFFSWHSYTSPLYTSHMADYVDRKLTEYGFGDVETQLNEWNNPNSNELRGTSEASSTVAAMMITMQHKKTDILCYYDARIGPSQFGGMFNPLTWKPFCTYYSFKAFGELYALGTETECVLDGEPSNIHAMSAAGEGGRAVLIANMMGDAREIVTNLSGMKVYLIDENHMMTETELDPSRFTLEKNQVVFIRGL